MLEWMLYEVCFFLLLFLICWKNILCYLWRIEFWLRFGFEYLCLLLKKVCDVGKIMEILVVRNFKIIMLYMYWVLYYWGWYLRMRNLFNLWLICWRIWRIFVSLWWVLFLCLVMNFMEDCVGSFYMLEKFRIVLELMWGWDLFIVIFC